jgi:hypothetical protein
MFVWIFKEKCLSKSWLRGYHSIIRNKGILPLSLSLSLFLCVCVCVCVCVYVCISRVFHFTWSLPDSAKPAGQKGPSDSPASVSPVLIFYLDTSVLALRKELPVQSTSLFYLSDKDLTGWAISLV